MKPNRKKRRRIWLCVAAALIILALAAMDCRLIVRNYEIDAEDIDTDMRIALVADLHSCRYGEGQRNLIDAIDRQDPDVIMLCGDIFDDGLPDDNADIFLAGIANDYPCYYVSGNHEYWNGKEDFYSKMAVLEKYGIPVLNGDFMELEVNGEAITLCGISDPVAHNVEEDFHYETNLDALGKAANPDDYTILLAHRPEYFDTYAQYDFDLVLSGHAHGGQWRIPGIINGLYSPIQGFFPEYAGGVYEKDGSTMVVSRGLARESTRIPRIFNRPELVIVDIK